MSYPSGLLLHRLYCRVGSYDGQDVINNLVMYGYLTQRASLTQPTLWWAILFLSPAQLIRSNSIFNNKKGTVPVVAGSRQD